MRWLIRIVLGLAMMALLALGLLALVPSDRVAQAAADEFQRLTGRALTFQGKVSPRFWPVLGVTTGPVTIANASWSDEGPMLQAESLVIEINPASLLGGEVQILGLRAVRPEIVLERGADGQANWVFGGGGAGGEISAATPGVGTAYTIGEARIEGGTLRFIDHAAGTRIEADGVTASLRVPDFTGPATLEATGTLRGHKVGLTAEAGVFSALTEGRVVPLAATLTAGGARADFTGRGGWDPMVAEGRLQADLGDLAAVAGVFGVSPPALSGLSVAGDLTLDGSGAVFLRAARIAADGNEITGDLDLSPGEARPKLTASLRAGQLDLRGGGAAAAPAPAETPDVEGWSRAVFDVSALGRMDAEIALVAGAVAVGPLTLDNLRALVTVDRARAVFDLREVAAYGGKVTGEFVVNGRGGLSVGGDLAASGIDLAALLAAVGGTDRVTSTLSGRLKFLGVGDSLDAILKSLRGDGQVTLGPGQLAGADLGAMLRTLDPAQLGDGRVTPFDGVSGSFVIAAGVATTGDLRLTAPDLAATGAGEVDLGQQTLDLRLRPTALAAADGSGGVMVPLLVRGKWDDLSWRLDLESIARERMEAEARAAEERLRAKAAEAEAAARAALEARLAEEGVVPLPGESLEDAARRRAEEALTEEAGRLLQDLLGD